MAHFIYGHKETSYLKSRDRILGFAIDQIGHINREVIPDPFAALIRLIVDQQISIKAAETIWQRFLVKFGEITAQKLLALAPEEIQALGLTMKKAVYIHEAAQKVQSGLLDLKVLQYKTDQDICSELTRLNGVGPWTAEMLMIFSMQRPNVISYRDLAIHRGLRKLYGHREIGIRLFEKYKRIYTPFSTVASLYLWAIAGGALDKVDNNIPGAK